MARKNIFDIVSENTDLKSDVRRVHDIIFNEYCISYHGSFYSISKYFDEILFYHWEGRGHCVNLKDFLNTINHKDLCDKANKSDSEAILLLLELYFNIWKIVEIDIVSEGNARWMGNFYFVKTLLEDCLSETNTKAYHDWEKEQVLLIEDKPEVTAAAEIVDDDLSLSIIKYNHHSLCGDVESKKSILLRLGSELEPKRKELKAINKQLEDNIFYMLNNLNLRHNNRSKKDKNYKEYVAKMRKSKLEQWYDELYQDILLALLLLDDQERQVKFSELRNKINGD